MYNVKNEFHQYIILDPKYRYLLKKYNWHFNLPKKYVIRTIYPSKKVLRLHHFILPKKEGFEIDHINRNPLDNRRCNLRYVTASQNSMNKTKQKNNTSGYRGVSWHKRDKKWQARITIKQKEIYIGCFDDIEDAICAYQQKAKELFGEYMGEF